MDLTYCRLCLKLTKDEFSVFDMISTSNDGCLKISEMIYACINLMILKDDNLIHNICDPCINDVIRCYNFRRKCYESDKLLNMKIGGILNEHTDIRIKIEHEDDDIHIQDIKPNILCSIKEELDSSNLQEISGLDNRDKEVYNNSLIENSTNPSVPGIPMLDNQDTFMEDMNSSNSELDLLELEKDNVETKYSVNQFDVDSKEIKSDIKLRNQDQKKLPLKKVKGKREYKCTVCLKNFKNITLLRLHSELHSERNNYLCGVCGQGFKQKQCLRAHNVRKHTARFKCQICSKTYVGNSQLFAHMRGHTGERPFSCEICGSTFARKYSVEIHMRTHTGERPFKCRYCEKTFIMHSHRRNHEINHMDPAQTEIFSCVICLKSFKRKDLYNLHLKVHSEERNEKCKYCSKKFKSRKSLSSHVRHLHKVNKEK